MRRCSPSFDAAAVRPTARARPDEEVIEIVDDLQDTWSSVAFRLVN